MFWEPFANDPVKVYFDLEALIDSGEPESASSSLTVSLDGFAGKDFPGSILVNNHAVSQAVQSATDKEIFYVSFPTKYLRPRGNCLVLRPNQTEEGAPSPSTYLDWIEVDYPSIPYVGQAELDLSERIPFDPPNGFRGACNLVSEGFQIDGIGGLRLARLDKEGSAVRFQDFPALSPD
ncbi:MAG: hypothetical protein KC940_24260, partial [Candidatus Omnitrophica bacterium]|nr:hypothetical protein [Candidatus Omnitrophota bacterium]